MAAPAGPIKLGVSFGGTWSGAYGTTSSGSLQQYQSWWNTGGATGHAVQAVTHFCYPSFDANSFTQPFAQVKPFYDAGGLVIMSLQGFPAGGSVDTLLAGGYDANITALGQAMAAYDRLGIRYAWEGNGTWFGWATGVIGVAKYQQMWNYTIPKLKAAGFKGFTDLNLENYGGRTPQTTGAGINPANVDVVSTDQYATVGTPNSTDLVNAWLTVQKPDFDACAALAASMGKPIGLPEFSTGFKQDGYGAGDDDYYLNQLAAWIRQHDVRYANVFDSNDVDKTTGAVINRHQWADPATLYTSGPFTDSTYFPKSIAQWKSSTWTAAALAQTATTGASALPVPLTQRRPKRRGAFQHIAYTSSPPASTGTSGGNILPVGTEPQSLASWSLKFSDDFDGTTVDTTKWNVFDGKNQNNVTCRPVNVSVAGSIVALQLSDSATGAEMATGILDGWGTDKYRFPVGGYAEAKCWFPGDGTNLYNWPAWWTSGLSWPVNGENDIAEVLSGKLTMNYHYGATANADTPVGGPQLPAATWGNGWHVFGVYRGAAALKFYWDGVLQWTTTPHDSGGTQVLILNIGAHSSNTLAGPSGALQVDYVRAWEPA